MITSVNEVTDEFRYLEALRRSGITNMFYATDFVQREFGVSQNEARQVLVNWMATYNPEVYDQMEILDEYTTIDPSESEFGEDDDDGYDEYDD